MFENSNLCQYESEFIRESYVDAHICVKLIISRNVGRIDL